ncbi:MAG TPA: hypothetical protein PLG90_02655 [Ignavibacteria bacterium]|nr:hypothetical protein [Ignavibacteria bacterium]
MNKGISYLSILTIIIFVFVSTKSNTDKNLNFSTRIYINEDTIFEGDEIFLNVYVKNNSPYKDSIKDISEYTLSQNLIIKNKNNNEAHKIKFYYNNPIPYYQTFEPNEEKSYRVNVNTFNIFEGLTPYYSYFPEGIYNVQLKLPLEDSVFLISNLTSFIVYKNYGKRAELFYKIRQLDSIIKAKSTIDEEVVDVTDNIINEYIEENLIESLINNNNITKQLINYKYDSNFVTQNLNYIKRNPNINNIKSIIGDIVSYLINKNNDQIKLEDIKEMLFQNYSMGESRKTELLNKIDSLYDNKLNSIKK